MNYLIEIRRVVVNLRYQFLFIMLERYELYILTAIGKKENAFGVITPYSPVELHSVTSWNKILFKI
jgi:hypothetical protein